MAGFTSPKLSMASCLPHRHGSANKNKVDRLVQAIITRDVKLLALDFDLTFIDIHTHGLWEETLDELVQHVRPCMRDLLQHAQHKGLFTCIVSFHSQPWLIRDLMGRIYPKKVAKHVYVQAVPVSLIRRENPDKPFTGKEYHIQKVIHEIAKDHSTDIGKREVLLLDDDMTNVRTATSFGHRSMQVQVHDKVIDYDSFESFERMLLIAG